MIDVYDEFVKDYNNPEITGEDIKRLNHINSHQYSKLRKEALSRGDITIPRHMYTTGAKFYTKTKNGDYIVKKQYADKTVLVGRFADEQTAKMIVSICKLVDWDLAKIQEIIDWHKIKPKNYTCVNGYYIVEKRINGERVVFCRFKQEIKAKIMVEELRKNDWDQTQVDSILCKIEEMVIC